MHVETPLQDQNKSKQKKKLLFTIHDITIKESYFHFFVALDGVCIFNPYPASHLVNIILSSDTCFTVTWAIM